MEDNLRKFAFIHLCSIREKNSPHAPDGSYVLEEYIGLILHTYYIPEMSCEIVLCVSLV